ncbi:MAG: asparaginase [Pseudomonadota bacterium]
MSNENENKEPTYEEAKSRVYVLYTGGTFGMHKDESAPGTPLIPMTLKDLEKYIPKASKFVPDTYVKLDVLPNDERMDSSSMTPKSWLKIAKQIEKNYDEFDGFVVIQGTDTLSYTASALSFMFESLAKPVVVTGSQLPLVEARTDANLNYGHALQIAAWQSSDLPLIPEVVVVFADRVLRGCRTRKMSASAWTGFDTPNCPPLGEIGEHVRIFESQILPPPEKNVRFRLNANLVMDVIDISLFPGFQAKDIRRLLDNSETKGVVLRTYGTGNAPETPDFLAELRHAIQDEDKVVVNITQCPQGMVEMGLYAASVGLLDAGVISGLDMTPEAALTKMMVTMGTRIGDQVKLQMQINQRGEQSQNLFDLAYPIKNFFPDGSLITEPVRQYAQPDARFRSTDISSAVLRIDGLSMKWPKGGGTLDVYMGHPNAAAKDALEEDHPQRIHRIEVGKSSKAGRQDDGQIVQQLKKDQVRSLIVPGDITLTVVPSKGVSFSMARLSLSLFTRA